MLIQCKLIRKGGTEVTLDDNVYLFSPNDKDEHVCDVTNKDHIATLLSISECYLEYKPKKAAT